jgi:hypothetical protein
MSDSRVIGARRAAQRIMANALSELKLAGMDGATPEEVGHNVRAALVRLGGS